ncbi:MAG: hypothetical protein HY918_05710 [Candidatus Doudnabacteria bacterium]|nr:hypothetical protein [Candidatus Doudnabacteria bacterium]
MIPILALCAWLGRENESNQEKVILVSYYGDATAAKMQRELELRLKPLAAEIKNKFRNLGQRPISVEIYPLPKTSGAYVVEYRYKGQLAGYTVVEIDQNNFDLALKRASQDISSGIRTFMLIQILWDPDSLRACRGFARLGTKKPAHSGGGSLN